MRVVAVGAAIAIALGPTAHAEDAAAPPDEVSAGRAVYARNCSPGHGPRMQDPEGAFDLVAGEGR